MSLKSSLCAITAAAFLVGASSSSPVQRILTCRDPDRAYDDLRSDAGLKRLFTIRDLVDLSMDTSYTALPRAPTSVLGARLVRVEYGNGEHQDQYDTMTVLSGNLSAIVGSATKIYGRRPMLVQSPFGRGRAYRYVVSARGQGPEHVWLAQRGHNVVLHCESEDN